MGVLNAVKMIMGDREWHSIAELIVKTGGKPDTVSASVRALRNKENGEHFVDREMKNGAWHYRIAERTPEAINRLSPSVEIVPKPLPSTTRITLPVTKGKPVKKRKAKKLKAAAPMIIDIDKAISAIVTIMEIQTMAEALRTRSRG